MAEFSAINEYLKNIHQDESVLLGIGDDAAVIECPKGHILVQTLDVMVHGTHFDDSYSAADLAYKLLQVNLSDIAAMGAIPKWATIGMTVPELNQAWLSEFSATLKNETRKAGVNLIGGDTSQGAFVLSMNLTGLSPKASGVLTRNNAQHKDDIYISGCLGDAALALESEHQNHQKLQAKLRRPQARLALGKRLLGVANACLDVSDGLLQDLGHICAASGLRATIQVEQLPLSEAYKSVSDSPDYALNGGDDYELCFTAHQSKRTQIAALATELDLPITRIGVMAKVLLKDSSAIQFNNTNHHANSSLVSCIKGGRLYHCQRAAWQHFQS